MRRGRPPKKVVLHDHFPTLRELGITKTQSSQWQKLAQVPYWVFEEIIEDWHNLNHKRLSAIGIIREWEMMNQVQKTPRRPASLERMVAELRRAGWVVFPPDEED